MGGGKSPMASGGGSRAGGRNSQPKTQREIQIDNLEQSVWRGSGKALNPTDVKVGDTIDGIQYSFEPNILEPSQKKGAWSGDYNGIPMKFKADNTFKVTSIEKGAKSTTITVTRIGGAGGTAKKKIPNDVYLRVYGR